MNRLRIRSEHEIDESLLQSGIEEYGLIGGRPVSPYGPAVTMSRTADEVIDILDAAGLPRHPALGDHHLEIEVCEADLRAARPVRLGLPNGEELKVAFSPAFMLVGRQVVVESEKGRERLLFFTITVSDDS